MKYTPGEGTGYTDLQVELDSECLTNPKRKNLQVCIGVNLLSLLPTFTVKALLR